jgi:hypothetical protein
MSHHVHHDVRSSRVELKETIICASRFLICSLRHIIVTSTYDIHPDLTVRS